jgi:hypothetical protein
MRAERSSSVARRQKSQLRKRLALSSPDAERPTGYQDVRRGHEQSIGKNSAFWTVDRYSSVIDE